MHEYINITNFSSSTAQRRIDCKITHDTVIPFASNCSIRGLGPNGPVTSSIALPRKLVPTFTIEGCEGHAGSEKTQLSRE